MDLVLQTQMPPDFWTDGAVARLPGVSPVAPENWLFVDEAFAKQMALRDQLIAKNREKVVMLDSGAQEAAKETLDLVLQHLHDSVGYEFSRSGVQRPDGVSVAVDWQDPLACAGKLVQEDLCLMQKSGDEHILSGAVLCFPSHWTLAQKFMRPLVAIHNPVAPYDDNIARRVQRMFDAIRPERPLKRFNLTRPVDAVLFSPRLETDAPHGEGRNAPYVRVERQCMMRLPKSQAVVFSVHTYVVRMSDLTGAQQAAINA